MQHGITKINRGDSDSSSQVENKTPGFLEKKKPGNVFNFCEMEFPEPILEEKGPLVIVEDAISKSASSSDQIFPGKDPSGGEPDQAASEESDPVSISQHILNFEQLNENIAPEQASFPFMRSDFEKKNPAMNSASPSSTPVFKCYQVGSIVGKGLYSNVFQALELKTGRLLAIKQLVLNDISFEQIKVVRRRLFPMLLLVHHNLATVHQLEVFKASCNIVYDLLSGGSLRSLLEQFSVFEEHLVQAYCFQLMEAVKYLHE